MSSEDSSPGTRHVYVVTANYYDETEVQGVYADEETAREAVEQSHDSYTYFINKYEVKNEPERHEPYF